MTALLVRFDEESHEGVMVADAAAVSILISKVDNYPDIFGALVAFFLLIVDFGLVLVSELGRPITLRLFIIL